MTEFHKAILAGIACPAEVSVEHFPDGGLRVEFRLPDGAGFAVGLPPNLSNLSGENVEFAVSAFGDWLERREAKLAGERWPKSFRDLLSQSEAGRALLSAEA